MRLDLQRLHIDPLSIAHSSDVLPFELRIWLLQGKLGVGKTQFARGFVRGASGDASLDVTSPTFLLDNSYPTAAGAAHGPGAGAGAVQVHHMDLYRLRSAGEAALLGIPHVFRADICIVEWPQRLQRLETREAAAAAAAAAEPLAEGATSADGARLSDSNGHSSAAPSHSGNSSSGSSLLPAEHLLVEIVAEDDVAFPRELLPALASHSLHALHVPVPAQAPIATAASTAPGAPATEAAADAAAAAAAIEVEEDTFSRAIVMVAAGPRMAAVLAQLELAMPGSGFQAGHGHGAQGQGSWEVHHEHGTGHGPAPRDGSGNSGQASGGGWPLR